MRYCNFFSLRTKSSPKRFQLIHLLNGFILQLLIPIALSFVFKKSNTSFENNIKKYYLIRICKKKVNFFVYGYPHTNWVNMANFVKRTYTWWYSTYFVLAIKGCVNIFNFPSPATWTKTYGKLSKKKVTRRDRG